MDGLEEHLLRYCARPPFALERLSVIRDADGRITRIRFVMPRQLIMLWAANWVGPGRKRKSTQPEAGGVIELAPFEFLDRLAEMPGHALEQPLAVGVGRLDQDGDPRARLRGITA